MPATRAGCRKSSNSCVLARQNARPPGRAATCRALPPQGYDAGIGAVQNNKLGYHLGNEAISQRPRDTEKRAMKFTWFNLMPWPYLPDDFREKNRSVWVDIDQALFDPEKSHEVYNTYMDLLEYASTVGFD